MIGTALPFYADAQPAPNNNGGQNGQQQSHNSNLPTRWTQNDVVLYCHSRFGLDDQSHGFKSCVERNTGKVGRPETNAEIEEINAAKQSMQ
jgi:hypothetical protein